MTDGTLSLPLSNVDQDRLVGGRYRLRALIGQGGMGAVYEAEHVADGRAVAVKMLLPHLANATEVAARFRREAKAATLLEHPNIVEVFDLVPDNDTLYLVMELIRGQSVAALIESGALRARRSLVIARQVLDGLAHAHAAGLVHRDLKPENIMVSNIGDAGREYDRVKILDFGVVKLVGDAAQQVGDGKLTRTGVVLGTPAYIAPEQALGQLVDGRADLYSMGIVLFEMLTGRTPFRSPDQVTLVRMQASAPIPTLASVAPGRPWCTPELEHLMRRALAKRPEQRFANAGEMIAELDAAFLSLNHLPVDG